MMFDYESVEGGYQYNAIKNGSSFRKFWHSAKLELFEKKLKFYNVKNILDLGCGSGNASFYLYKKNFDVFGADIAQSAINFCKVRAKNKKINLNNFKIFDGKKIPFKDNEFDAVLSSEVIEHLNDPLAHLKEAKRVLKKKGILLITTPNYHSLWKPLEFFPDKLSLTPKMKGEQHIFFFNPKNFKNLLNKSGFELIELSSYYGLSPFFSFISIKLARKFFKKEINHKSSYRMILYAIARKK